MGAITPVTTDTPQILPFTLGQGLPTGTVVGNAGGLSLTGTVGHITRLVLYNRELTTGETTLVTAWLKHRYGIA